MSYRVVDADDLDPEPDRPCTLQRLSAPADLDGVALNRFEAAPGEQLPLAYHYHDEQEEAFYVLEGTLSVETPAGTYTVPAGSLFACDPGDPQRAYNPADADGSVSVLAIGVPPAADDVHPYDPDAEEEDGPR
ncbi:cupin domain-containing protein [Halomarina ordinaria]|uniref:Cupin domain-containing protein n=1 Tax=Halomarina ordinaria TaxID=3033939 RepID=A0ABD5UAG0_9EURY|nr:cupin domain-containing protein [Halomarina sp. PSRA2]